VPVADRSRHACVLTLVLVLLAPAGGAVAETLVAEYRVTWAGLEIGRFEAEVRSDADNYRASYQARTTGFLDWLVGFASEGSSEGRWAGGALRPRQHEGQSRWRDRSTEWWVRFEPDGRAAEVRLPPAERADREPVPPALQVAPDPLALLLQAIAAAEPAVERVRTSFDGRRALRFRLACADESLPAAFAAGGPAQPPALRCTVSGELLAGASKRWRNRGGSSDARRSVDVRLARGIVAGGFWPVAIEAPSRYGTVAAHLVRRGPAARPVVVWPEPPTP
jgi:hypothetical protein